MGRLDQLIPVRLECLADRLNQMGRLDQLIPVRLECLAGRLNQMDLLDLLIPVHPGCLAGRLNLLGQTGQKPPAFSANPSRKKTTVFAVRQI